MRPISKFNVMIAPAFYGTQVDIGGPFKAYSMHHKSLIGCILLYLYISNKCERYGRLQHTVIQLIVHAN